LFGRMPVYSGLAVGIFFAALGLPGLCGFIGEVFVVLGTWNYSAAMAVMAASVVILTAGYILWTIQRVYLGAEYKGPHSESLSPITRRETLIAVPLLAFAVLFGVYPKALFDYMSPSINKVVDDSAAWQKSQHKSSLPAKQTAGEDRNKPLVKTLTAIEKNFGFSSLDSPSPLAHLLKGEGNYHGMIALPKPNSTRK
jgi:NADH-quinone oxidoreductase subunit M